MTRIELLPPTFFLFVYKSGIRRPRESDTSQVSEQLLLDVRVTKYKIYV